MKVDEKYYEIAERLMQSENIDASASILYDFVQEQNKIICKQITMATITEENRLKAEKFLYDKYAKGRDYFNESCHFGWREVISILAEFIDYVDNKEDIPVCKCGTSLLWDNKAKVWFCPKLDCFNTNTF